MIYIFSIFPWKSDLLHREHQLALSFKELGHDVSFVERKWGLPGFIGKQRTENGVNILPVAALPYLRGRFRIIFKINDWLLKRQLRMVPGEALKIVSSPLWAKIVGGRVVYDMSDDVLLFTKNKKWHQILEEYENILLNKSELVVVTSKNLLTKIPANKESKVVENGVDVSGFAQATPALREYKGNVIGFIGGIFDWVDLDLVEETLKVFPEDSFVFIGPTNQTEKINKLSKNYANFYYLGSKPWQEIGNYFASFDVGLIPFVTEKEYPRLSSVNSNKLFQYAYFGYPIVSTFFEQAKGLGEMVYVSKTKEEFISKLREAVSENSSKKKEKREKFALAHSWENQAKSILEAVSE